MGVACSPDLANLYGAHFEEAILGNDCELIPEILFFGRYIDDVFSIIAAETKAEALVIASRINYEGLEMEWSASEWNMPFLDMFVYINPTNNQIGHMPYRKPLNHKERIPWASHHPIDVKKGTFIGEMSRLATLSSSQAHYLDAIRELGLLYLARGYPVALVHSWIKAHLAKRWTDRLSDTKARVTNLLVLKTEFNPVWEKFNVKELYQVIQSTWIEGVTSIKWCSTPGCMRPEHGGLMPESNPNAEHWIHELGLNVRAYRAPAVPEPVRRPAGPPTEGVQNFYGGYVRPAEIVGIAPQEAPAPPLLCPDFGAGGIVRTPEGELNGVRSQFVDPYSVRGEIVGRQWPFMFDIRKTGLLDANMLLSRKRNQNLGDLMSVWRQSMLDKFLAEEDHVLEADFDGA